MNKEKIKNIVSQRVHSALSERGMTRFQFAERVGISYGSLASYLSARALPPLDVLINMADVLGVSVGHLCGSDISEQNGEPAHVPHEETQADAPALLRALYQSAKALNLSPDVSRETGVVLKSDNALVRLFFEKAQKCQTESELATVLSAFADAQVHDGEMMDPVTYQLLYGGLKAGE